jgi:hypothetical protein
MGGSDSVVDETTVEAERMAGGDGFQRNSVATTVRGTGAMSCRRDATQARRISDTSLTRQGK